VSNITVSHKTDHVWGWAWARTLCASGWAVSVFALGACQGELKLNDGVAKPPQDMTMAKPEELPATIGYADINRDMDTPPGLGCTNQISGCHGGATPTGKLALADMAAQDMAKLMGNYTQVQSRITTSDPPNSLLLLKMLSTAAGGTAHSGGTYFQDKSNIMYRRWLVWIQLGAPFEAVSTSGSGGGG
jgi:hypothetical protein